MRSTVESGKSNARGGEMREFVSSCRISGCNSHAAALGLCWKHYARRRRHGDAHASERRYMLPPECRHCGTREPGAFYSTYKSICKVCRKIRSIQNRQTIRFFLK
jgi:hypothetical protein